MVMKQVKTTKFNQQKSSSSASNGHYDNHRYSNSSNGSRFSEPANNSTIFISSSFMLMIIMASFYILLFCSSQPGSLVQAQPLEIHSPYNHRSAMNTLKELDKYYSQKARPRFGKRTNEIFVRPNLDIDDDYIDGAILDNGPYRWLLLNREQPLTKLTENYLLKILAENESRKQNMEKV